MIELHECNVEIPEIPQILEKDLLAYSYSPTPI